MKTRIAAVAAVLALAVAPLSALAQPKGQKGKAATGQQVRYFDLSPSIFSELGAESILKETRQGATVTSAELDICYLVSPTAHRLDRFVVPLKVDGNRLTGSVQSQERKQSVTVNLTRRAAGGNVTFEGTVSSGNHTDKVRSTDNTDLSEEEIADQYLAEPVIEPSPADFSAAWPQTLHVRVTRSALPGLLEALRDQTVRVVYNGLQTSCQVLRSGRHTLQIDVEAERVGAVLAKLKAVSGVAEIGFSPNSPNMQRAVRFPSAGWRDGSGKLDRDKLAAAVSKAIATAMSATVGTATWDAAMGELAVEVKRPDETVAGLKLAQVVTVTIVIAPESLTSNQRTILWIESVTARIADERAPPRLTFAPIQPDDSEGQPSEPDGSDELPDAVAAALKGVTWDSDKEQWRP
jgi:hypothetical protein